MDCARNCAHLRFEVGLLFLRSKLEVGIAYDVSSTLEQSCSESSLNFAAKAFGREALH
jgi:hypothetical protein